MPNDLSKWVLRDWQNGVPEQCLTGISHDTRTLKPGDLYVAIRGERFDGHAFVQDAFEKGAVGALVCDDFEWTAHPVLQVEDTLIGLQDFARGYRKTWTGLPIGITGSVGKTTVKEMCADVLSVKATTHRTAGNYNNHIGLPLTMLSHPLDAPFGVFEIGMNQPGEIAALSDMLLPEVGIITDICNAHRERFNSLKEIAEEKMKLVEKVPSSGVVLLDCDSEWYDLMRAHTDAKVRTLAFEGEADYVGRRNGEMCLNVNGYDYEMPQLGEHIMRNALRAIALGHEMNMMPEEIAEGLSRFEAPPFRWEQSEVHGVHFINDAYNANPLSMRASLQTFSARPCDGAKWAVVGGMRELGTTTNEEHIALATFLDQLDLDGVITVGELGQLIACKRTDSFYQRMECRDAAEILRENLKAGDCVLLKASRGEQLEAVIHNFKEI